MSILSLDRDVGFAQVMLLLLASTRAGLRGRRWLVVDADDNHTVPPLQNSIGTMSTSYLVALPIEILELTLLFSSGQDIIKIQAV